MKQDFLEIFGLPLKSKKVLLDIIAHDGSSVAEIATRLHMPKSSVYDAITPLLDQSLINEYSNDRGKTFGVSDHDQLMRAHQEKIEELQKAQASLFSFIKNNHSINTVAKPKIKFYSGILGIKQAFRDMPWQKHLKDAYMIWPAKDMVDIDEDFFRWHGTQRLKHGILIHAIEKHSDRVVQKNAKLGWLKNDPRNNFVSVRYLPKGMDFKMSFWLYGDKCLFASSGSERVAFTVHSKEFAGIIKIMWESLWETAQR